MTDFIDTVIEQLKFAFACIALCGVAFLLYTLTPDHQKQRGIFYTDDIKPAGQSVAKEFDAFSQDIAQATSTATHAVGGAASSAARGVGSATGAVAHSVGSGVSSVAGAIGDSITAVVHAPKAIAGVIRPAGDAPAIEIEPIENYAVVPTQAAAQPISTASAPATPVSGATAWPLRGEVTTEFGVYHEPYQAHHSGMDISSGRRSGIMPIRPFKAGKVVDVIRSRSGLGNHVIVDHGGGLTSSYCHLYSIAVSVGQAVDLGTTLGTEGSTGVSTGTHLHFEIRQGGLLQDPRKFIAGNPY